VRGILAGNLGRLLLSLVLLAAMIIVIGPESIARVFRDARPGVVVAAFILVVIDSFVRAVNWGQLLRAIGVRASAGMMHYCLLAGGFFGALFPSSVSTDVARSMFAARILGGATVEQFAATVATLNLIGLLSVCLLGAAAALWYLAYGVMIAPAIFVLSGSAIYAACFLGARWWAARRRVGTRLDDENGVQAEFGWRARAQRFTASLLMFSDGHASLRSVLGIGLCNQITRISVLYIVNLSVGAEIPWVALCLFGPILVVARALPLSMAGFGTDQAGFIGFFLVFGVRPEQGLVISLINSVLYFCLDLLGGVVYSIAVSRRLVLARLGKRT
jgi:hypothetical protein